MLYCLRERLYIILEGIIAVDAERCWSYTMLENVGLALNITSNVTIKRLFDTISASFISNSEVWLYSKLYYFQKLSLKEPKKQIVFSKQKLCRLQRSR